jgi:hypothetical protein
VLRIISASTKIAYFDLNVKLYFTSDVQVLREEQLLLAAVVL